MPVHLTQEQVFEALKGVKYPNLSRDIVSFGLIKGIELSDNTVRVKVRISTRDSSVPTQIENEIRRVVGQMAGVRRVEVEMNWTQPETQPPGVAHAAPDSDEPLLPGVRMKVAVASGKGGVGKSTVAAGLALMLQKMGYQVGLADFDIYGPSVPTILGVHQVPRVVDNRLLPLDRKGMKLMSMGFLVDAGTPMIWRGPMVHQATEQFLRDVDWGPLDILIIDLPPGTGDAQLTLSQKVTLNGVIIVSTPQDLALIDARKGVAMFQKMNVPILGIVENMSGFTCPHCGETTYIFGREGAEREAKELDVPFLAHIPLVPALVEAADRGDPASAIENDAKLAEVFASLAARVGQKIGLAVVP